MEIAFQSSRLFSIAAFLYYGLSCLFSNGMAAEFERYGLSRFRRFTGGLEVLGALGLLAGYRFPNLVIAAASGLALLMLLGVITRLRVGDRPLATVPAVVLLLANLYILVYAIRLPGAA